MLLPAKSHSYAGVSIIMLRTTTVCLTTNMPDRTVATQYNIQTVNLIELFVLPFLNYFAILYFAVLTDTG